MLIIEYQFKYWLEHCIIIKLSFLLESKKIIHFCSLFNVNKNIYTCIYITKKTCSLVATSIGGIIKYIFNYAFEISSMTGEPVEACIMFKAWVIRVVFRLAEGKGQGLVIKRINQRFAYCNYSTDIILI